MPDDSILKAAGVAFLTGLACAAVFRLLGRKYALQVYPVAAGIVGILFQLLANRGESFWALGFTLTTPPVFYLVGLLAVVSILLEALVFGYLFDFLSLRPRTGRKSRPTPPVSLLVLFGALGVLSEELVFRGLIQRQLMWAIPLTPAILIASVLGGLWHIPVGRLIGLDWRKTGQYTLGTAMAGAIFGAFYYLTESLIVPMVIHGAWTALVYTFWGVGNIRPGLLGSKDDGITSPEYGVIGLAALGLTVGIVLVMSLIL